ncbi:heat shock protein HtpX [Malaciobacter marinus]|jgi:heat shock protein HtpX|uniref:Protease HtpX homolog n=1 Tax=Malaciobacter marinus TaxID=505249 RepID=A0AB36ZW70_9BACT|nr:zinc metalloprotease HtpX [Malaciobacter marinus]PPK60866.1 heat shock protein HtpX [Malaciobacter marinus]SKB63118.1 heat shock protein HtpX [Malaciobacter marinus]
MEQIKTVFFLALLSVLFVFIGYSFGGPNGMLIAFLLAAGMNFYAYYYSDKHVLSSYNAVEILDRRNLIYQITQKLAYKANLPMPRVYIIPDDMPNAFATGRNHQHAAIAVTQGLMDLLNEKEIEGVIAHELSHVRHYDILIGTIAAVFAGAIAMIANMMQFSAMFGGNDRQNSNPFVMIVLAIILPLAAAVIQMTVSRSREYLADEGAARLVGDASGLQSALSKLESYAKRGEIHNATEQTAHMFIINPFSGKDMKFSELFRTHPTTEDRIARLEELKSQLK